MDDIKTADGVTITPGMTVWDASTKSIIERNVEGEPRQCLYSKKCYFRDTGLHTTCTEDVYADRKKAIAARANILRVRAAKAIKLAESYRIELEKLETELAQGAGK